MTTIETIQEHAQTLGAHAADAYSGEFDGEAPAHGWATEWAERAWEGAKKELCAAGMGDADYDTCLAAWRLGFFGD